MKIILIASLLNCPKTEFINKTNEFWNEMDYKHLSMAQKRCGEIYKNSPCLKLFIKRTVNRDYSAICGKELEK
jgi:hypothetical protein